MDRHAVSSPPQRKLGALLRLCGILTLVLLVIGAAALGWRLAMQDRWGSIAVGIAVGSSWLGAAAALILTALARGPNAGLTSLVGGMFFRVATPLITATAAQRLSVELADAGVFGWTVLFYLVALVTETLLSLRLLNLPLQAPRAT